MARPTNSGSKDKIFKTNFFFKIEKWQHLLFFTWLKILSWFLDSWLVGGAGLLRTYCRVNLLRSQPTPLARSTENQILTRSAHHCSSGLLPQLKLGFFCLHFTENNNKHCKQRYFLRKVTLFIICCLFWGWLNFYLVKWVEFYEESTRQSWVSKLVLDKVYFDLFNF